MREREGEGERWKGGQDQCLGNFESRSGWKGRRE